MLNKKSQHGSSYGIGHYKGQITSNSQTMGILPFKMDIFCHPFLHGDYDLL